MDCLNLPPLKKFCLQNSNLNFTKGKEVDSAYGPQAPM